MDPDNDMQQTTHELSQMNIELQNKKLSRPHPLSKQPSRASSLDTRTSTPVADINGLGWPGMLIYLRYSSFSSPISESYSPTTQRVSRAEGG